MTKLVRGGVVLSLIGMFLGIIYGQTKTVTALNIAKDSQVKLENSVEPTNVEPTDLVSDDKKLVKKTAATAPAAAAGKSRGSFTATAYCLKGRTAMGHGVRRGIIAADPRILRLGSRVNLGAGSYSGNYLVSDTGGRIKGRKIDIWVASCAEARRFGRRTVTISQ